MLRTEIATVVLKSEPKTEEAVEALEDPLIDVHKCKSCAFRTNSVRVILSHLEDHRLKSNFGGFSCTSDLEAYKCQICHFKSDFQIAVYKHESLVHWSRRFSKWEIKLKSYVCEKCGFETYSLLVFVRHLCNDPRLEEAFKSKYEQCEKCRRHHILLKRSTDVKWFECEQCCHKTNSKRSLKTHILWKHSKPEEIEWFECERCCYKAKTRKALKDHVKNKHSRPDEIKWFECAHCSYKSKHKGSLNIHVFRRHSKASEVRWFACDQCFHKSKTMSNLRSHILWKHSKPDEVKLFECEKCCFKTKLRGDLNMHVLYKHSKPDEIKWFECERCSYKTKYKSGLKTHVLRKHLKPNEIKWFECEHCCHKFKTNAELKSHMLRIHNHKVIKLL